MCYYWLPKPSSLVASMVLVFVFFSNNWVESRQLPFLPHDHQQGSYEQVFASLGMVCKCCEDGKEVQGSWDGCASSWDGSCSNLQCQPWKSHL